MYQKTSCNETLLLYGCIRPTHCELLILGYTSLFIRKTDSINTATSQSEKHNKKHLKIKKYATCRGCFVNYGNTVT